MNQLILGLPVHIFPKMQIHLNVSLAVFSDATWCLSKLLMIVFSDITADLSSPDIEGVYETQVPLEFRALVSLGCLVTVDRGFAKMMAGRVSCVYVCVCVCLSTTAFRFFAKMMAGRWGVCVYVFLSSQTRNKILCQNDGRQDETSASVVSNILQVLEPSNINFVQQSSCLRVKLKTWKNWPWRYAWKSFHAITTHGLHVLCFTDRKLTHLSWTTWSSARWLSSHTFSLAPWSTSTCITMSGESPCLYHHIWWVPMLVSPHLVSPHACITTSGESTCLPVSQYKKWVPMLTCITTSSESPCLPVLACLVSPHVYLCQHVWWVLMSVSHLVSLCPQLFLMSSAVSQLEYRK